jgi:hypothetical protein
MNLEDKLGEMIKDKMGGVLPKDREWMLDRLAKDIYEYLASELPKEFDGENNPMLNEYTRGYNTCLSDIKKKWGKIK